MFFTEAAFLVCRKGGGFVEFTGQSDGGGVVGMSGQEWLFSINLLLVCVDETGYRRNGFVDNRSVKLWVIDRAVVWRGIRRMNRYDCRCICGRS